MVRNSYIMARNVRLGSGTEIPCSFGTSGSIRIAALGLASQVCHGLTFLVFARFRVTPLLELSKPVLLCCEGHILDERRLRWAHLSRGSGTASPICRY